MRIVVLLILIFTLNLSAQLEFKVITDKQEYDYGETITIQCYLTNAGDSSETVIFSSSSSCQAIFELDDFQSGMYMRCLSSTQEITLSPGQSRIYTWYLDPTRFGLPKSDGIHKIKASIRYRKPPYFGSPTILLKDSVDIDAPKFFGGQLYVGFDFEKDFIVSQIKDSLNIAVLERNEHSWGIAELWQFTGTEIDSMFSDMDENTNLNWVQYNRWTDYDSIYVTDIEEKNIVINSFHLGNAYPNPFNPTTTINYQIPNSKTEINSNRQNLKVEIIVYDILGRVVSILIDEYQKPGYYKVEFNGANLPSGIYFYRLTTGRYSQTKKLVLIK